MVEGTNGAAAQPPEAHVSPEMARRLVNGEITLGEFAGFTKDQLYAIAQIGYRMLVSGQLEQAKIIYQGLVAVDPFDSVFHCHLASIQHRLGEMDDALKGYTRALQLNIANVDALAGRGELHLSQGRLTEALTDLRKVLELDSEGKRGPTVRVRAILLALNEAANKNNPNASSRE